jgi:lipid-binding SYLF domain-containing protein
MKTKLRSILVLLLLMWPFGQALADQYTDTINLFREAGVSRPFFDKSYGYAVFPMIGKGGYVIGGAHGTGRVYRGGTHVGDSTMNQVTLGFQLGGQAYSQIIFLEDKRAFDEFTNGEFEFGAQATAVAITAGASVQGGTMGSSAGASGTQHNVKHAPVSYQNGMAVFTITKGGLMYEATIGGQHFDYVRKGEVVSQRPRSTEPPVEGEMTW